MSDEDIEKPYSVQYLDNVGESAKYIHRAGKAKVVYANGDVFEGTYNSNGERHGTGTYKYKLPVSTTVL